MRTFQVDPNLDIPIYQQLVDEIRMAIRKEELPAGSRLPTVEAMARDLGLARGTVNHVYTELAQLGLVEKIQGRGTFVSYQPPTAATQTEQALEAIDHLLDRMDALGIPPGDARRMIDQRLRQRQKARANLKVAVVECNPETLARLTDQLRFWEGIDLYPHLLSEIEAYPYQLGDAVDLIVTTAEHTAYMQSILPEQKKIARIALRLSPDCVGKIVKLKADERIGLLGCSWRFTELLRHACDMYAEHVQPLPPEVLSPDLDLAGFLSDKTTVLVPEEYEKYTFETQLPLLQNYARQGNLIRCSYEMDEGSCLYLQEKIGRLQEQKSI